MIVTFALMWFVNMTLHGWLFLHFHRMCGSRLKKDCLKNVEPILNCFLKCLGELLPQMSNPSCTLFSSILQSIFDEARSCHERNLHQLEITNISWWFVHCHVQTNETMKWTLKPAFPKNHCGAHQKHCSDITCKGSLSDSAPGQVNIQKAERPAQTSIHSSQPHQHQTTIDHKHIKMMVSCPKVKQSTRTNWRWQLFHTNSIVLAC